MKVTFITVWYEEIHENFWYGLFGEFKLIINKITGSVNATKICHEGGKRFRDWSRSKGAHELLDFYRKRSGSADLRPRFQYNIAGV